MRWRVMSSAGEGEKADDDDDDDEKSRLSSAGRSQPEGHMTLFFHSSAFTCKAEARRHVNAAPCPMTSARSGPRFGHGGAAARAHGSWARDCFCRRDDWSARFVRLSALVLAFCEGPRHVLGMRATRPIRMVSGTW
jgi:hypothetical protein